MDFVLQLVSKAGIIESVTHVSAKAKKSTLPTLQSFWLEIQVCECSEPR